VLALGGVGKGLVPGQWLTPPLCPDLAMAHFAQRTTSNVLNQNNLIFQYLEHSVQIWGARSLDEFVPFSPRSSAISVNAFEGIEACSLRNQKTTFRPFIRMRLPNYLDDRTMDDSRPRQPGTKEYSRSFIESSLVRP
jgi:hypothetical protein